MSIRAYLKTETRVDSPAGRGAQGVIKLGNGSEVSVSSEGGMLYVSLYGEFPKLHPELAAKVSYYTYLDRNTSPEAAAKVKTGTYEHGKFRARVDTIGRSDKPMLEISAKAPTIPMLMRWVHAIVDGRTVPKPFKSQTAEQAAA
jgi:hypothetical protein